MFLQETNLTSDACLRVLTHLPIPKVIFTSAAGCIMYDRVNQLETSRGGSRLAGTACPLWAGSAPFVWASSPSPVTSAHSLHSRVSVFDSSIQARHKTNRPDLQKRGAVNRGQPVRHQSRCSATAANYLHCLSQLLAHSSSCRESWSISVCVCVECGAGRVRRDTLAKLHIHTLVIIY